MRIQNIAYLVHVCPYILIFNAHTKSNTFDSLLFKYSYIIFPQNKMNLFVLSGHGSESFVAFLNGVIFILQKNNAALITAAVTTAQITR